MTKLNPFGAFVEIEPKIQGLCHISEFTTRKAMEETLSVGTSKDFQILEISPEEHRMSLRIDGTAPAESAPLPEPSPKKAEPQEEEAG
ncbi:MAG: S1 RNA-binding domain-containing protein [bacterium]|nr:S1 RNA-binding domain-containing protein [bacterium]